MPCLSQNPACNNLFYTVFHPSCWNEEFCVPTVGSTLPDGSAIPAAPVSGEAATQTIQAISNQQVLDWQSNNINSMAEIGRGLPGTEDPFNLMGLVTPIMIGVGVVLVIKLLKR